MNIRNGLEMITPETYGFIYMTYNMVNGKKYIGQKKISNRGVPWKDYLGSGKLIRLAVKKYGEENFYKDILEACNSPEELNEREIYWISHYNATKDPLFYNICAGGTGANYWEGFDEETLEKIREKHSQSAPKGEQNHNSNLTEERVNEIIELFLLGYSTIEIEELTGVPRRNLSNIREKRTWRHMTQDITFPKYDFREKTPPVLQYDYYGKLIHRYNDMIDLMEQHPDYVRNFIVDVCRHKCRTAYGYLWFYENDKKKDEYLSDEVWLDKCRHPYKKNKKKKVESPNKRIVKPIVQYDFYGNLVGKYNSPKEAGRILHIDRVTNIYKCLHKKEKTSMGYIWAYEDDESIYDIINNQELLAEYRRYYTPKRIKNGTKKPSKKKRSVLQFSKDGIFIAKYDSITEADNATHAGIQNISAVCKRKCKSRKVAGGFIWRFEDDAEDMLKEVS